MPQVFWTSIGTKPGPWAFLMTSILGNAANLSGSLYVNDFNKFGRPYQVTAQADAPFRRKPEDIVNLKARNATGEMVPLGTIVKICEMRAPESVRATTCIRRPSSRQHQAGRQLRQAMRVMSGWPRVLPPGMGFEWTEMSLLQRLAGNSAVYIFPLCVLMAFSSWRPFTRAGRCPWPLFSVVPMPVLRHHGDEQYG